MIKTQLCLLSTAAEKTDPELTHSCCGRTGSCGGWSLCTHRNSQTLERQDPVVSKENPPEIRKGSKQTADYHLMWHVCGPSVCSLSLCEGELTLVLCLSTQNEEVLKKCAQEYLARVKQEEQRYQTLKIHAEEKLDKYAHTASKSGEQDLFSCQVWMS